jgi:glycosyltransferase involved in cell wall biosynthesis
MDEPGLRPLVSIGLPVHNGAQFLAQAIDSLLAQTYQNFAICISDNASTDDTQQICLAYASRDSRIRYVRNATNLGAFANFKRVLDLATGKYFMWAADHDLWAPGFLTTCVDLLEQNPEVVLCAPRTAWIDTDGKLLEQIYPVLDTRGMGRVSRFNVVMWGLGYCYQVYGMMRTDALRSARICTDTLAPDTLLLSELSLFGAFADVPELLFYQRRMPGFGDWGKYAERLRVQHRSPWVLFAKLIYYHLSAIHAHARSYREECLLMLVAILCTIARYAHLPHVLRAVFTR